jgi:integrase
MVRGAPQSIGRCNRWLRRGTPAGGLAGGDIGIISKHLGHRDNSTTARYLDHVAPWAVVEAVAARWVESPRLAENVAGFPNLR